VLLETRRILPDLVTWSGTFGKLCEYGKVGATAIRKTVQVATNSIASSVCGSCYIGSTVTLWL